MFEISFDNARLPTFVPYSCYWWIQTFMDEAVPNMFV